MTPPRRPKLPAPPRPPATGRRSTNPRDERTPGAHAAGRLAMTIPAGRHAEGPSIARVYDYLLGGSDNFTPTRKPPKSSWPGGPTPARRCAPTGPSWAVPSATWQPRPGIRQFLDIGSGIPTMGNVHEIAQQAAPDARVVYVDNEEVAVLHSQAILARNQNATAIQADLRRPREILGSPQLRDLLDLSQPVALLLVAVLHFFPDSDEPGRPGRRAPRGARAGQLRGHQPRHHRRAGPRRRRGHGPLRPDHRPVPAAQPLRGHGVLRRA